MQTLDSASKKLVQISHIYREIGMVQSMHRDYFALPSTDEPTSFRVPISKYN